MLHFHSGQIDTCLWWPANLKQSWRKSLYKSAGLYRLQQIRYCSGKLYDAQLLRSAVIFFILVFLLKERLWLWGRSNDVLALAQNDIELISRFTTEKWWKNLPEKRLLAYPPLMPSHKVGVAHLLHQLPMAVSGIYFSGSCWKQSILKMRLIFYGFNWCWTEDVHFSTCKKYQIFRQATLSPKMLLLLSKTNHNSIKHICIHICTYILI